MADHSKVAIFWDYENCCPPSTQGLGYDIANNIGHLARVFGCVTTFKAYLDISAQPPKGTTLRSELQLSGVSVIDCPHNGRKEVVDKMVIVDMLAFAVDHPPPATVVLIAGDRDYAYVVSTLRLRNYNVVLVTPRVTSCLEAQASVVVDWNTVLSRTRTTPNSELPVRRPYPYFDADLFAKLSREVCQLGDDDSTVCSSSPPSSEGAVKSRPVSTQDLPQPTVSKGDGNVGVPCESTRGLSDTPCKPTNVNGDSAVSTTTVARTPSGFLDSAASRIRSATVHSAAAAPLRLDKEPEHQRTPSFMVPSDVCLGARGDAGTLNLPDCPVQPTLNIAAEVQSDGDGRSFPIPIGSPPLHAGRSSLALQPPSVPQFNPRLCMSPKIVSPPLKTRTITGGIPVSFGNSAQKIFGAARETSFPNLQTPKPQQKASLEAVLNPYADDFVPTSDADLMEALGLLDEDAADPSPLRKFDSTFLDDRRSSFPTSVGNAGMVTAAGGNDVLGPFAPAAEVTRLPLEGRSISSRDVSFGSARTDAERFMHTQSPGGPSYSGQTKLDTSYLSSEPAPEARLGGNSFTDMLTEDAARQRTRAVFLPLIQRLLAERDKGVPRSSRSEIAVAVMKADKDAYRRASVATFKDYTALAQRAGLVVLGGSLGDTWISLHPNWSNAVLDADALSAPAPPDERAKGDLCVAGADVESASVEIDARCFQPLVTVLLKLYQPGHEQVMRSQVGQMLEPDVYRKAGVACFKDYVARAVEHRIVVCGGHGGSAWIRLHPDLGA